LSNRFVTVSVAVCTVKPEAVPSAVNVVAPIVAPPVNVNVAVVCPDGIETELGETVTSEVFPTERLIVAPVDGAG
jgi:hypothetical protein